MEASAQKLETADDCIKKTIHDLRNSYQQKYGTQPSFVVRVPGRVNLIGEHIDYCGYAVFPMAIDQAIFIAADINKEDLLHLSNYDHSYVHFETDIRSISIDKGTPHWYKYFLCGVKGVMEHGGKDGGWKGMNAMVHGLIPPSAGLSSSSALVCAAAVAFACVNQIPVVKSDFAEFCARSERYIGTEGGGMDQAIAMLASKGTAKLIEFNPLRAHDTQLPAGAAFVIAHCLAEANKAASHHFNCRVMECRLAAKILAKLLGADPKSILRLIDVQRSLNKTLPEMASVVSEHLHDEPYTKGELAKLLEISEKELENDILSENTRHIEEFRIKQRALHVFQEANRVWEFKKICADGGATALEKLGQLMSDSHGSCKHLYECSHPQLDRLVELSTANCLGARLTGAGWGGCMVALVSEEKVDCLINHLKENYYAKLPEAQGRNLDNVIFATQPGEGATIFSV